MNTPLWNDSQIHAFVDGALDADTAARLEADSRADSILAARIAKQRELRALLRGAFDPVLDEPVPQRLRDALAGPGPRATVTPIGAARAASAPQRPVWSKRQWGAVAATLVLGVLVGSIAFRTPGNDSLQMTQGGLVARGELDSALSTQLSGATTPSDTHIGLSFRAADGAWCRTFNQRSTSGLACRRAGSWTVQLLEGRHSAPGEAADFRQAASSLSPALLDAIKAQGGGDAIDAEQEQQQLRAGWE